MTFQLNSRPLPSSIRYRGAAKYSLPACSGQFHSSLPNRPRHASRFSIAALRRYLSQISGAVATIPDGK